jgi:hypothetical protein
MQTTRGTRRAPSLAMDALAPWRAFLALRPSSTRNARRRMRTVLSALLGTASLLTLIGAAA